MSNLLSPQKIWVTSQWDEENRGWWASNPAKEMKGSESAQIDYCPIPPKGLESSLHGFKIWGLWFWNSIQIFVCHLWTKLWKSVEQGFWVCWGGGVLWGMNARNDLKTNAWCDLVCEPTHTCSWSSPSFWRQHILSRKAEIWLTSELNCRILVLLYSHRRTRNH